MITNKTWASCTEAELEKAATPTEKEKAAVADFIRAAQALPRGIVVSIDDDDGELVVSKMTTKGSSRPVARLKKKSLCFDHYAWKD